jgi:hypothetical protein
LARIDNCAKAMVQTVEQVSRAVIERRLRFGAGDYIERSTPG